MGSMPGSKSLELNQYYAHPQNQFWKVIAALTDQAVPKDYKGKLSLLHSARIALWDVLSECTREASSDATIRRPSPNAIKKLLASYPKIKKVILNGKAAEKYYKQYFSEIIELEWKYAPSTSPAHASLSLEQKIAAWQNVI